MRGLLIDPFAKTITEIEIGEGDNVLPDLYKAIHTDIVEVIRMREPRDGLAIDLWVDEEGLFKNEQKFFMIKGSAQQIAGRAVVLQERNADCISTTATIENIEDLIAFELL
jgi:hypothetical protein